MFFIWCHKEITWALPLFVAVNFHLNSIHWFHTKRMVCWWINHISSHGEQYRSLELAWPCSNFHLVVSFRTVASYFSLINAWREVCTVHQICLSKTLYTWRTTHLSHPKDNPTAMDYWCVSRVDFGVLHIPLSFVVICCANSWCPPLKHWLNLCTVRFQCLISEANGGVSAWLAALKKEAAKTYDTVLYSPNAPFWGSPLAFFFRDQNKALVGS